MKFKKIIALGAAASMILSANVFAAGNITVNGNAVEGSGYKEGNVTYIPLRSVAEALDFEVQWNGESKSVVISNLPQYVTMTVGVDGYTFARTAPIALGAAPVINDGLTYVPSEHFTDILEYNFEEENIEYSISYKIAAVSTGTVSEVNESSILFVDDEKGEVVLNVSEDIVINDAKGNAISFEDINVGDRLNVEYGDAMTMSLPPVNNPAAITVLENDEETTEGTTEETFEASTEETTEALDDSSDAPVLESTEETTEVSDEDETTEETTSEETTEAEISTETTTVEEE